MGFSIETVIVLFIESFFEEHLGTATSVLIIVAYLTFILFFSD